MTTNWSQENYESATPPKRNAKKSLRATPNRSPPCRLLKSTSP